MAGSAIIGGKSQVQFLPESKVSSGPAATGEGSAGIECQPLLLTDANDIPSWT